MAKVFKSIFACLVILALISSSIPQVSSTAIAVVENTAKVTALGVATSIAGTILEWLLYIPSFLVRQVIRSAYSFVLAPLLVPIRIVETVFRVITFPIRLIWNIITFPIRLIVAIVTLPFKLFKAVVDIPKAMFRIIM